MHGKGGLKGLQPQVQSEVRAPPRRLCRWEAGRGAHLGGQEWFSPLKRPCLSRSSGTRSVRARARAPPSRDDLL